MNETAEQFIARKQAYPGTMSHMESPGENTSWDLVIEASTYYAQSNSDSKVFVIQRLSGMPNNDREYRIGYYRRDGNGHWMWTQRSPMFPLHDLEMLMALARGDKKKFGGEKLIVRKDAMCSLTTAGQEQLLTLWKAFER